MNPATIRQYTETKKVMTQHERYKQALERYIAFNAPRAYVDYVIQYTNANGTTKGCLSLDAYCNMVKSGMKP